MWIDDRGTTVLPSSECKRLLAVTAKEGGIGRIGVPTDQAPVVVPVNFSIRDGEVVIRTGVGFLSTTGAGRLVAFEVDHVDPEGGTAWSVLVRGLATLVESPSREELQAAAHPLVPEPGDMLLIVRPDIVSGRQFQIHRAG
ncbi:MAG: pyridoxamine 5'-phosphate oxidase family protein [Acidimicrobiales bacterium]|jgi:nitroimidazol reductase NimA-like FMN-containing flavoprotein (pyridoxamine 5'-phosphate oxidase superfamily)